MFINTCNQSLILASASPRRKALLEQLGLPFVVVPSEMPEPGYNHPTPADYVRQLAEGKARCVASRFAEQWVIAADTAVILDGSLLDKPLTPEDSRRLMRCLSGRRHEVYTGFCVCCLKQARCITRVVKTDVCFRTLSEAEIRWYATTPEPYDKAGGYGVQGLGAIWIRHIDGSYANVVGLPVCELVEVLLQEQIVGFAEKV